MTYSRSTPAERGRAALGAAALTGAVGYLLAAGLGYAPRPATADALAVFDVRPDPPPPAVTEPHQIASRKPEGRAAPPNLRAEPTEVVAPDPVVPLVVPPPLPAAPIAGAGAAPRAGSADVVGPGTGSGGQGDGRGSGGAGNGDGDGGDETPPRWIRGSLRDGDYPREAAEAGVGGTVGVRYLVWTDGRVTECDVTRSSGNAALDAATCRLIQQRFRFRPSRDAKGRPVPSVIVESHEWVLEREPARPAPPPRRRTRIF